jgi:hypothetical protein
MSLLAIKGIYENGQIILEEDFFAKKPVRVIVTFLDEKQSEPFESISVEDAENELQWQTTLEKPQPELEQLALAALQQAKQGKTIKKGFDEL